MFYIQCNDVGELPRLWNAAEQRSCWNIAEATAYETRAAAQAEIDQAQLCWPAMIVEDTPELRAYVELSWHAYGH